MTGGESETILALILDIGVAMMRSGAETHRVEDSLYRLCDSYAFQACNIWVIPSNIQASVQTEDGRHLTQIRHIRQVSVNFDLLDRLNNLSREVCATVPDAETLKKQFSLVSTMTPEPAWRHYFAGILAAVGFGIFFNCDIEDAATAFLAAVLITFMCRWLSKRETNPLIVNFITSFLAELFIIFAVHLGLGHHPGYITVGVVMLLISGAGTTNGIRDLVHLDTLSGTINVTSALTGAIGIALGIAVPIRILPGWSGNDVNMLNPNLLIQLLSCTAATLGFAIWFHVRREHVPLCALGAFIAWLAYLAASLFMGTGFSSAITCAIVCGFYSQIVARIVKAPVTVFSSISIFPLIPGASLYYMMAALVMQERRLALEYGITLFVTCFAIVLGYMAVEVVSRHIWRQPKPGMAVSFREIR